MANGTAVWAQAAQPSEHSSAVRYDGRGRLVGQISPDPDGTGPNGFIAKRTSYDAAGLVVRVESGYLSAWQPTSVAPANWPGFTVLQTEHFAYDMLNKPVKSWVTGSDGATVSVEQTNYDRAGREACTAVRMNSAAFASPPANACHVGAEGTKGPDRVTQNHYDAAGQVTSIRKAVGTPLVQNYVSYTYTPNGKQQTVRDANGNLATLTYDGFDRQKLWIFPSKTSVGLSDYSDYEEYGYDDNNNKVSHRKRDGSVITVQYDALNRVTAKIVPERAGLAVTHTRDVYYGYDNGNLQIYARFDGHSGEGVNSSYDGFGRLTSTSIVMSGLNKTVSYQWDKNGNRKLVTHADGAAFFAEYDALDRLKTLYEGPNNAVYMVNMTYNQRGALYLMQRRYGNYTSFYQDAAGRLNESSHAFANGAGTGTWQFAYNPASQITTRSVGNDTYAYTGHVNVNRNYAVNGLNQYTSAGPATFAYDANGNLTSDGANSYTYDIENRLVQASGASNATLRYDPLGRLHETSAGSLATTTRFHYDGDELIGEYNDTGTLLRRYVHGAGIDDPVLWYEGSGIGPARFLHSNWQGSIIAIADNSGNMIATNRYDEYGIPAQTNVGRFQYTGQAWIPELRMYYYKARIYSPTLGRFLQTDPIGYEDQVNLYAYVGNDPVNMTDPAGTCGIGEGNFDAGCWIEYGPESIPADKDGQSSWAMQRRYRNNDGGVVYFDPAHFDLGSHVDHGQTVQSAVNGQISGSSLAAKAQQSLATGESVPVSFRTTATSMSGHGNYTILWEGELTATETRYDITAVGTIATSDYSWDQDSTGTNWVRDNGTRLMRQFSSGTPFVLIPNREIEGYFAGNIQPARRKP